MSWRWVFFGAQNDHGGTVIERRLSLMMAATNGADMNRIIKQITAGAASLLLAATAGAEELVAEFQGTGNQTTIEFKVDAPWILDWRINSDYNKMVSFDLDLVDGQTGMLQGVVVRSKALGNGVRMFNTSGRFRFRVNASFIRWHLKVKELTPAEAELYTPRQPR